MVATRLFAALAALALAACSATPAPYYGGSLTGSATYRDGGDSSSIAIVVSGPASAATLTDSSGAWSIASLPPGAYAISATAPSALEPLLTASATVGASVAQAPALVFTGVGSLAGSVVSAAGPVEGALVLARGTSAVAVSDASGAWRIDGLVAGSYDLVASLAGEAGASASGVAVVHGQTAQVPPLVLSAEPPSGASISGALVIAGLAPQQGLPVSLQGPVSSAAITDAQGAFSFAGLPDGAYTLSAQVRSALPALQTLAVTVTSGTSVSGATLDFSPLGIVRGTALFPDGRADNSGISVTADGTAAAVATDALGRYQLTGVPAGSATVRAAALGLGSASAQVAVSWDAEVVAPEMTLASSVAVPTGEISGHALLAGGSDSSGITVTLRGPASASQVTGPDGAFDFTALPPGGYQLVASADGTREGSVSAAVTLASSPVSGISLQLTPVAALEGLVTAQDGTPVPQALVFVNGGAASAVTAVDGSYVLGAVPVGATLALQASTSDALSQVETVSPLSRGEVGHPDPLVLAASGHAALIAGAASLVGGAPAAGAQLSATGPGLQAVTGSADSSGAFSISATEGIYSLSLAAADGSAETFSVAALTGGDGLVWGGPSAMPVGTVELQWAPRLASAPDAAIVARAQSSLNPSIQSTDDALVLSGVVDAPDAPVGNEGYPSTGTAAGGWLWLASEGRAVRFPAPGVFAPTSECTLSDALGAVAQPGPVLGPEHTALFSLPEFPFTPGPLEVGRPDGTMLEVAGPMVDNVITYSACLGTSCVCARGEDCTCSCSEYGAYTNALAAPIASGGDTVAYLGWGQGGDVAKLGGGGSDQIYAFDVRDVRDALGADAGPAPLQITSDDAPHLSPVFVSPDGQWLWYASTANEQSSYSSPQLAVISIAACESGGPGGAGCAPLPVTPDGSLFYDGSQTQILAVSADGKSVLGCVGPESMGGRNADGSTDCNDNFIASADGTVVRDLAQASVYQLTGSDGTQFLLYDDQDDGTGVVLEPFSAARARAAVLAPDGQLCQWDYETDGAGIVLLGGNCAGGRDRVRQAEGVVPIGRQTLLPQVYYVAVLPLDFGDGEQPAVVESDAVFDCVAPLSGTEVAYVDDDTDALQVLAFTGGTVQLDDGSGGAVVACGAVQRFGLKSGQDAHRFLDSTKLAWLDVSGGNDEGTSTTMRVADLSNLDDPAVTAQLALTGLGDCAAPPSAGATFNTACAVDSPAAVNVSADGSTAAAFLCGLAASPGVAGGVELVSADGSRSGSAAAPVDLTNARAYLLLADGTAAYLGTDAASGEAIAGVASLSASGDLSAAPIEGTLGTATGVLVAPDESAAALLTAPLEASAQGVLATLAYVARGAGTVVASGLLVQSPGQTATSESKVSTGVCLPTPEGLLPGLGLDASPDGSALLFRSGVAGTPEQLFDQQGSAGVLQSLRWSDGKLQPLIGRASQAAWLPDGSVLGVRQATPPPYQFQDGIYLAAPWGTP